MLEAQLTLFDGDTLSRLEGLFEEEVISEILGLAFKAKILMQLHAGETKPSELTRELEEFEQGLDSFILSFGSLSDRAAELVELRGSMHQIELESFRNDLHRLSGSLRMEIAELRSKTESDRPNNHPAHFFAVHLAHIFDREGLKVTPYYGGEYNQLLEGLLKAIEWRGNDAFQLTRQMVESPYWKTSPSI